MSAKRQEGLEKYKDAVSSLLRERGDVLVSYCEIISLDADEWRDLGRHLQKLSQLLTDYSALGHFEVLEPLLESSESPDALQLSQAIQDTTDYLLRFSDEYSPASGGGNHNVAELSSELETLGEKLAERFEMEDRVISQAG